MQVGARERFGDVVVHAGGQALLAVALHGHRGLRDDDAPRSARFGLAQGGGGTEPVQTRHVAIHQDQVEVGAQGGLDGSLAIADQRHPAAQ